MSETQLTQTGNLPVHYAAAACYVPFMSLNLIASIGFLAMEPKENTEIRFHAAQSLLVQASWFVAVVVSVFLLILLQVGGGIFMSLALTASESVGSILAIGMGLFNLLMLLVVMVVSFGGILVQLALTALAAMEKNPRVPVLAKFADRFSGAATP